MQPVNLRWLWRCCRWRCGSPLRSSAHHCHRLPHSHCSPANLGCPHCGYQRIGSGLLPCQCQTNQWQSLCHWTYWYRCKYGCLMQPVNLRWLWRCCRWRCGSPLRSSAHHCHRLPHSHCSPANLGCPHCGYQRIGSGLLPCQCQTNQWQSLCHWTYWYRCKYGCLMQPVNLRWLCQCRGCH